MHPEYQEMFMEELNIHRSASAIHFELMKLCAGVLWADERVNIASVSVYQVNMAFHRFSSV
jgi:hypothetical protein